LVTLLVAGWRRDLRPTQPTKESYYVYGASAQQSTVRGAEPTSIYRNGSAHYGLVAGPGMAEVVQYPRM